MYQLGENQPRCQEFLRQAPEAVGSEAVLLRTLIERAARENRPGLVNSLVATLAKVAATHQATQIKAGQMLEKATLLKLATVLCDVVCAEIQGGFVGWEDAVNKICNRMEQAIEAAGLDNESDEPAPLLLTDERSGE